MRPAAPLYPHRLATGDFQLALRGLLGHGAPLAPRSLQRLRAQWEVEYQAWRGRGPRGREVGYLRSDGLYVKGGP